MVEICTFFQQHDNMPHNHQVNTHFISKLRTQINQLNSQNKMFIIFLNLEEAHEKCHNF
jgi:hypothetical protein